MIIEIIIVAVVVLAASVLAGRSLFKTLARENAGCGCTGSCSLCSNALRKTRKSTEKRP